MTFDQLRTHRLNSVLLMITAMLVMLAVVNAIFIAWWYGPDTRQASALAQALGVHAPWRERRGLAAAQALPALAGAVLGIPAGLALFTVVTPDEAPNPPLRTDRLPAFPRPPSRSCSSPRSPPASPPANPSPKPSPPSPPETPGEPVPMVEQVPQPGTTAASVTRDLHLTGTPAQPLH